MGNTIETNQIKELIPHREPFLFIDKLENLETLIYFR